MAVIPHQVSTATCNVQIILFMLYMLLRFIIVKKREVSSFWLMALTVKQVFLRVMAARFNYGLLKFGNINKTAGY